KLVIKKQPTTDFQSLLGTEDELRIANSYGLNSFEYKDLLLDLSQAVSLRKEYVEPDMTELEKQAAFRHLSWLVGVAFGRWNKDCIQQEFQQDLYSELPEQPPAFKWVDTDSIITSAGVMDLTSQSSMISS